MKSKSIFLMAVSLGFGLIAAIGISQVMGRSNESKQPEVETMSVIVAVEDIDALEELTPEKVKEESWPIDQVPEGVATSMDEIEGKVMRSRLAKQFPIQLSQLVDKAKAETLAIPPGYKVIGIKVAADDHIHGLLQPGDLVDIIGVFRQGGKNKEPISKTFLKKIRVFSVNGTQEVDVARESKIRNTTVVSVLATERQSEKLVLVQRVAEVKLVLRGKSEEDEKLDYEQLAKSEAPGETTIGSVLGEQANRSLDHLTDFLPDMTSSSQKDSTSKSTEDASSKTDSDFVMRIITAAGTQTVRFGDDGHVQEKTPKAEENESSPADKPTKSNSPADSKSEDLDTIEDSDLFDDQDVPDTDA